MRFILILAVLLSAQTPEPSGLNERSPGVVFDDCEGCPEMVVLPAGQFTMGSTQAQKSWAVAHGATARAVADEAPEHRVSLRSFALGEYAVTRVQYAAFVTETGYEIKGGCGRDASGTTQDPELSWRDPGFPQTELDPVVCVSWRDAQAYVNWVNQKVRAAGDSGSYRLPTEAEWEYAARAGSAGLFWWGDDLRAAPEHAWYSENADGRTRPIGSKPANGFGVFDIVGNVWQWTADCYAPSYAKAAADGRALEGDDTCSRVDRGGGWMSPAWMLRSSTRERHPADFRNRSMGFRVARDL